MCFVLVLLVEAIGKWQVQAWDHTVGCGSILIIHPHKRAKLQLRFIFVQEILPCLSLEHLRGFRLWAQACPEKARQCSKLSFKFRHAFGFILTAILVFLVGLKRCVCPEAYPHIGYRGLHK